MTTSQLILMSSLYLAAFVGVAYLTRAKVPRIAGALGGGAVCGVFAEW
jgi:Kef-type K+ transport system membrane component KefB